MVCIQPGKFLPTQFAVKQTVDGWRDKLRQAVDVQLRQVGWRKLARDLYAVPSP